nr:hypothetical protein [Tanacetum cinerariifolium]
MGRVVPLATCFYRSASALMSEVPPEGPTSLPFAQASPSLRYQAMATAHQILGLAYPFVVEAQWHQAFDDLQLPLYRFGDGPASLSTDGLAALVQYLETRYRATAAASPALAATPPPKVATVQPKDGANGKKKGGRPKKTEEEKQKNVVVVRFSAAIFAQLESHARVKGQTLAGVVKQWMSHGRPVGLTAEQHANVRCLPQISNDLKAIAELLKQQPGQKEQAKAGELLYTGRLNAPSNKQPLILFAEGVRTDNAQVMGADFEWGCTLNPNVNNPVWHTSISFNPSDAEKLTNEKMLAVAQDFRKEMGLLGTQCVIIRHFDKEDNQHLHILVNRVADDGHSIPDGRNFYRSKLAVAKLCEEHGLTPAAGQRPELQHPERIAQREEQQQAEAREHERVRFQAQQALTELIDQKAFASHAEFRGQAAAQGYTFVTGPAGEAQLRHEASARQFDLAQVQPGGLAARPLWEQVEAVVLEKAAEERARQAARREEARRETEQALTQTRDSGLGRPEQFYYRLQKQPYDLMHDPQTRELTHVRHQKSGELFAYAEVQPSGAGAPPLAEQLATAVRTEQQRVRAQQELAAGRAWAQGRAQVENVTTQVRNAQQFFDRDELAAQLKRQGVTLLPPPAAGLSQLFLLDATKQVFLEREVMRGGTVAEMLTGAEERRATRRQDAWTQTSRDIEQTLHAPETPLTSIRNYQQQLEARGYKFRQQPGQAVEIEHLASGERFDLRQVQPGGPAAPALDSQVRDVLAQQKQQQETQAQPTKDIEHVLAAKNFTTWPEFEAQVQAKGYQFVTGLDGRACLLHEQSRQLSPLEELQPTGRDLATQHTAAPGESVSALLQQTGATVREMPGATAGALVLEVAYHTERTDVKMLTKLLDQWQHEESGIQIHETDRARQSRGGQAPKAEITFEYVP